MIYLDLPPVVPKKNLWKIYFFQQKSIPFHFFYRKMLCAKATKPLESRLQPSSSTYFWRHTSWFPSILLVLDQLVGKYLLLMKLIVWRILRQNSSDSFPIIGKGNKIFKDLVKWQQDFFKISSNGNKIFKKSRHMTRFFKNLVKWKQDFLNSRQMAARFFKNLVKWQQDFEI